MTWSILVRDPATGALGAAVATRFFAVGALAIHVEGGVAALATQALINPMYASAGMARLRAGEAPDAVASALLAEDAGRDHRQLHMIDARGRIAQWTGGDCVAWCGAVRGADVSVAGNMLAGAAVVERTLDAFQHAAGTLAERLITALEAGEAAGGDKRGKQSAALKICTRDPYPDLDIRTDDHPDPLARTAPAVCGEPGAVRGVPPLPRRRRQPVRRVRPRGDRRRHCARGKAAYLTAITTTLGSFIMRRLLLAAACVLVTAMPAFSQTLRIALRQDLDVLDPTLATTYVGRIVFAGLCDKLFDIDEKLNIVPQLATGYEWADDRTLVIHLRPA